MDSSKSRIFGAEERVDIGARSSSSSSSSSSVFLIVVTCPPSSSPPPAPTPPRLGRPAVHDAATPETRSRARPRLTPVSPPSHPRLGPVSPPQPRPQPAAPRAKPTCAKIRRIIAPGRKTVSLSQTFRRQRKIAKMKSPGLKMHDK
jgi:hypothetical protein